MTKFILPVGLMLLIAIVLIKCKETKSSNEVETIHKIEANRLVANPGAPGKNVTVYLEGINNDKK
jgi:hypothetical protein